METKTSGLNEYSQITYSTEDILNLLLSNKFNNSVILVDNNELEMYNSNCEKFNLDKIKTNLNITVEEFHNINSNCWNIPKNYKELNMRDFLLLKCRTEIEIQRVELEYKLFEEKNLIDVLRLFKYIIDKFKENNIIWGVGRGSSVASYILYLMEVHRVDSLKYGLDIKEFLKD